MGTSGQKWWERLELHQPKAHAWNCRKQPLEVTWISFACSSLPCNKRAKETSGLPSSLSCPVGSVIQIRELGRSWKEKAVVLWYSLGSCVAQGAATYTAVKVMLLNLFPATWHRGTCILPNNANEGDSPVIHHPPQDLGCRALFKLRGRSELQCVLSVSKCTMVHSTAMVWIFCQEEPECSGGIAYLGTELEQWPGEQSQPGLRNSRFLDFRQNLYMFQMELKKLLMHDTVVIELSPCTVCGLLSTPPAAFWQLKHVWKLQWIVRVGFDLFVKLATLKVIVCQTHPIKCKIILRKYFEIISLSVKGLNN